MDKKDLRKQMKNLRKAISLNEKNILDKKIESKLFDTKEYKSANVVFIYVSISDEINTIGIIKRALSDGKRICVPKVLGKTIIEAIEIKSLDDLNYSGAFGILEPTNSESVISEEIDLSIVPGLAFDSSGRRLGYGGGFYDRFFEKYPHSVKVSLCYLFQLVTDVYPMPYDINVDMLILEDKVIYTNK